MGRDPSVLKEEAKPDYDWPNIAFLIGSPLALLVLAPIQLATEGFLVSIMWLTVVYTVISSLSLTAGYHRLFSHRSYEANRPLRILFLLFGAGTIQNSVLEWGLRHRRHHRYTDTDRDPYNIKQGFWYAHFTWIFRKYPVDVSEYPADLADDQLILWQHRFYLPIAFLVGFVIPTCFGWALGSWFGGFVWAALFRIVFLHHCSFLVNSYLHSFGRQPYCRSTSARDSTLVALLSYGEGFHNFHHRFQYDYRNGVRWYHWDPTKWLIRILSPLGITANLRRAPERSIQEARRRFSRDEAYSL